MEREKAKRKYLRSNITRKYNKFEQLMASEDDNKVRDATVLVNQLEVAYNDLMKVQNEILDQVDTNDIETEMEEAEKYLDYITSAQSQMRLLLREDAASSASSSSPKSSCKTKSSHKSHAKLPKLTLPTFSGNYIKWTEFWELFECNVHNNPSISDIEKFSYLRGLIKGDAQRVIDGLSLTSANYVQAVELLKKRFGSSKRILKAHVREMLQIEPIKTTKNGILRSLVDKIMVHVRALTSLGLDSDTYGAFLMQIIISRLPHFLRVEWARRDVDDDLEIDALMAFLNHEASALEVTADEGARNGFDPQQRGSKPLFNAATFAKTTKVCPCCNKQNHLLHACAEFKSFDVAHKYDFLRSKRLCYVCFCPGHGAGVCDSKFSCRKCSGKHNTALHRVDKTPPEGTGSGPQVSHTRFDNNQVSLPTVLLECEGADVPIVALLDSGSQITLIEKSVAEALNCTPVGVGEDLHIFGIRSHSFVVKAPRRVKLMVDASENFVEILATEMDNIGVQVRLNDGGKNHMCPVQVILGADMLGRILTGKSKKLQGDTICFETVCGWSHMGIVGRQKLCSSLTTCNDACIFGDELEAIVKRAWEVEAPIQLTSEVNSNDLIAVELFERSISRDPSGRYTVAWPMKESGSCLKSYAKQAYARFEQSRRRFNGDVHLRVECQKIINDYVNSGVIEIAPPESDVVDQPIRYLPYQPVIKWDKVKSKVRLVFDASAKDEDGVSLNQLMYAGPNLNPEICELLIRFRASKIALVADIEKAFLQLNLQEGQRNLTRFFWPACENDEVVVYRFRRVLFGARGSPFLLAATLRHHLNAEKEQYPETVVILEKGFYVDDLVVSTNTVDEARRIRCETVEILEHMGANIRDWICNSNVLQTEFSDCVDEQFTKDVLGVSWRVNSDTLVVPAPYSKEETVYTKRTLLRFLAQIWDPLGILSPLTISGKVLMRKIWQFQCDWDSLLPTELHATIDRFFCLVREFHLLEIPRCLEIRDGSTVELHAFGDASALAIGAVVYARVVQLSGEINLSFVIAKAKLTPKSQTSIPRLELLACMLAAKLVTYAEKSLPTQCKLFCWTDSRVALAWISSCDVHQWKQFVSNRVQAILDITPPTVWHFVSGVSNPADVLSRGLLELPTYEHEQLIEGPSFLRETCIVKAPFSTITDDTDERQISKEVKKSSHVLVGFVSEPIVDLSRFSSLKRLLRIMAWVRRFIQKCREQITAKWGISKIGPAPQPLNLDFPSYLTASEINCAEMCLIKQIQTQHFSNELCTLTHNKSVQKTKIATLRPFLDEQGVLRSDRRLNNTNLTHDEKFPIIIPRESKYAELLISDTHQRLCHASTTATLCDLRNKFWITRARAAVKAVIHQCSVCKRDRLPSTVEDVPPLPYERVTGDDPKPFRFVGIDFTGPITRDPDSGKKLYILLVTCTRIRAVHLELVDSLDRSSCISALKCFFFRRGIPELIISDNAKTFKAVAPLVTSEYRVQWQFVTPYAPWRGGFYERLNKSIKEPLRRVMGKRSLECNALRALLCQIEAIVNSRPLVQATDDPSDSPPITPSHFLVGESLLRLPCLQSNVSENAPVDVQKLWRGRNDALKLFWKEWQIRYLRELRVQTKKDANDVLVEGDLVLVGNERERNSWPLAIVEALHQGKDGRIRTVSVRIGNKTFLRPIQRIYKLEGKTM